VPPTISAFWRMLLGGAMLGAVLVASGQWRAIRARDVFWMVVPAIAFATDLFAWHRSILIVGPGVATLLGNLQVFLMAVAGVALHRERLGWRFGVGLLFAFGGLWMLIGRDWLHAGGDYRIGVALGAFTALCYAVYMLSFRHAQRKRSTLASSQLLAISSLLCAGVLAIMEDASGYEFVVPDTQSWLALIGLGLVASVWAGCSSRARCLSCRPRWSDCCCCCSRS
jgi:drug/metabolite transporter (DMT)-like permease